MADQAFFSTLLDIPIEILVAYARDYAPGQRTVAFCLDTSGNYSYPKKALDGFTQLVADTARPGDVFYFIAAGDNPLAPEAIFHTVRMPVPILPAPTTVSASPTPPGPSPTPCNFFDAPCRNRAAAEQQQAQATATAVQQAAAEATAAPTRTASALIEQSQRYLSSSVTDLRGLSIPPAASSNGPACLLRATQLLRNRLGERVIAYAGPMKIDWEQLSELKLTRIRVRTLLAQCQTPADCQDGQQAWEDAMVRMGAVDQVRFYADQADLIAEFGRRR